MNLLAEDKHAEKEDPENSHGVPVPRGAIDDDLTQFNAAQKHERRYCCRQSRHADQQMQTMGAGDEVKEMAAGVGGKEHPLIDELFPGHPLSSEKQATQKDRRGQPGGRATDGRPAKAQPFFHHVDFLEEVPAADFHGEAAQQNQSSVDPEDGGYGDRSPVNNPLIGGSEMAGALAGEKGAH